MVKLLLLAIIISNFFNDSAPETILIKNGNILTMENEQVLKETDIRIKDGIIVEIGRNLKKEENERVIDANGKYIIPALFDMHAHLSVENPWYPYQLALFKFFGVHDVHLMAGNEDLLTLSNKVKKKEFESNLPYPDLYIASELIDGSPPLWGEDHNGPVLTDTSEVKSTLRSLKDKGYRDIKIYNQLTEIVYLSILEEASKMELRVIGHVPYELNLDERLNKKHQRIEHLEGYLEIGYSGDKEKVKQAGLLRNQVMVNNIDWNKLNEASKTTKLRGIWNTPTHVTFSSLVDTTYIHEVWNGKYSSLLDPILKGFWSNVLSNEKAMPHLRSEEFRTWHLKMIQSLHKSGAKILVGTDSPLPILLYGHSVHKELQYFVQAGMSEFEALRTATVLPAEYLDLKNRGKIQKGFESELVILNSNPLKNISNTLSIHSTISGNEHVLTEKFSNSLKEYRNRVTDTN